jgi:hypothetical protein
MNHEDPTRREFLLKIARGAVYSAPLIATFAVAPDLLAQAGSAPGHHHMHAAPSAPQQTTTPSDAPGASPTEKHPPPSRKGEGG